MALEEQYRLSCYEELTTLGDQNTLIYSDALSIMKNGRRIHNNNSKKISCKILSSADLLLYFL